MAQTILTVVLEVQPASAELLRTLIATLRKALEVKPAPQARAGSAVAPYDYVRQAMPALHFMSISVADDDQYDPVLVLEANFDGDRAPFWTQLESAIGAELREMFRLCKPPRDERLQAFQAATAAGSTSPLGPLFEAFRVTPSARHQGNRGLDRARILAEGALFDAVQTSLDAHPEFAREAPEAVHGRLRALLLPAFDWLRASAPSRIPFAESVADWLRLIGFAAALLAVLALAGWLFSVAVAAVFGATVDYSGVPWLLAVLLDLLLGLIVFAVPAIVLLRRFERRDAAIDAPKLDEAALRRMARREDKITQNHMISIVHVKPGILRTVLARLAHKALGLVVRVLNRSGYLKSMRTIHFAHWAFLDNGARLMFHSNFDGSWESYLDDFIEKAHGGLTLAWTHGVGFPPTRFLREDGATDGRRFKAWARHSMSESQFWFSAYPDWTVNQIERHARVADGLRRASLAEQEARKWAMDL